MTEHKVLNGDILEHLRELGDKSVHLAILDPPYFRIMIQDHAGEKYDWDNEHESMESYQEWIENIGIELKRVLSDNASLYVFCDDKVCAYVQVILDKYFSLLNNIVWRKPNNMTIKGWSEYRSYAPITERILFYTNEWDINGLKEIYGDPTLFKNIKDYLKKEKQKSGLTNKDFNLLFSDFYDKKGCIDRSVIEHYFGNKQWVFPTEEIYKQVLQKTGFFQREYEDLKREYESLKREYESLRRPFSPKENFTDVWDFNIIGGKENLPHPTQKPLALIRRIVEVSSREGDLVLDGFSGSGTTALACKQLGRNSISIEREPKYLELIKSRLSQEVLSAWSS